MLYLIWQDDEMLTMFEDDAATTKEWAEQRYARRPDLGPVQVKGGRGGNIAHVGPDTDGKLKWR